MRTKLVLALGMMLLIASQAAIALSTYDLDSLGTEIDSLKASRYNVERLEDLLSEARTEFEAGNVVKASSIEYQIRTLIEETESLGKMIEYEQGVLASLVAEGMNTSLGQESLAKAKVEFTRGNLDATRMHLDKATSANSALLEERYGHLLTEINTSGLDYLGLENSTVEDKLDLLMDAITSRDIEKAKFMESDIEGLRDALDELEAAKRRNEGWTLTDNALFSDLEDEARTLITLNQLRTSEETAIYMQQLMDRALSADEDINKASSKIGRWLGEGEQPPISQEEISDIRDELTIGNIERAENKITDAILELESWEEQILLERSLTPGKRIGRWFMENLFWIVPLLIVALVGWIVGNNANRRRFLEKRLQKYKKEQITIVELIKQLQRDYYIGRLIPREEYDQKFEALQERQTYINGKIPVIEKKLKKHG